MSNTSPPLKKTITPYLIPVIHPIPYTTRHRYPNPTRMRSECVLRIARRKQQPPHRPGTIAQPWRRIGQKCQPSELGSGVSEGRGSAVEGGKCETGGSLAAGSSSNGAAAPRPSPLLHLPPLRRLLPPRARHTASAPMTSLRSILCLSNDLSALSSVSRLTSLQFILCLSIELSQIYPLSLD